jgi:hypothetical protein
LGVLGFLSDGFRSGRSRCAVRLLRSRGFSRFSVGSSFPDRKTKPTLGFFAGTFSAVAFSVIGTGSATGFLRVVLRFVVVASPVSPSALARVRRAGFALSSVADSEFFRDRVLLTGCIGSGFCAAASVGSPSFFLGMDRKILGGGFAATVFF